MKDKHALIKWVIAALVLAFCFWHPLLRQVVLFILPLGSGFDDFVFFALLVFAVIGGVLYVTNGKFWIFENKDHPKRKSMDGLEPFDTHAFKKGK